MISYKNSISKRINLLIASCTFILSVFMIGINLIVIKFYTRKSSEIMIQKTCAAQTLQLNNQLSLVEQSVKVIYDISEQLRPSFEEMKSPEVTNSYIDQFRKMAISIAKNTDGAIAIYYRINPEMNLNGTQGFFYVKSPDKGIFEASENTDLFKYDSDDIEHVGWYYIPVSKGKPVWMAPYYNANINVWMISYVVPVFEGSNLLGVVGMDIDFERLISIAERVDIYKSSGGILCNLEQGEIYYTRCNDFGNVIPDKIYSILQNESKSSKIIHCKVGDDSYAFHYQTLNNGMKLIVYAEINDINSHETFSILTGAAIFALVFLIDIIFAIKFSKRLTNPIKNITLAAKEYAAGKWETKVQCDSEDELKELTDSISLMAENTRNYINYINDMAQKDSLTELKNKTAYMMYLNKINLEYIPAHKPFAIIIFDLNNLKHVNDTIGHEQGDELIVLASKFICKMFAHSPVFRIGGDEFISILDSADYDKRNELEEEFNYYMSLTKNSNNWKDVCIACGMSTFMEDGQTFDEIFKTADRRMYENKILLKNGENIR